MNTKKTISMRKTKKPLEEKDILPPPRVISHELYFPRFGTAKNSTPPSPFIIIDGKLLRSAMSFCKKKSTSKVKFPDNDFIVTAYFESIEPWDYIIDGKENSEEEETDESEESDENEESEEIKSESSSDGSLYEKIEENNDEGSQRSIT